MDWGLRNRISRILQPADGRTVMLAVDHGYFLGPTHRLEKPRATIAPLLPYADAIMLTRGVLRTSVDPDADKPMVLRVSGGTSVLQEDLSHETITTSVKEALRLNATAVALSIFVGAPHEHESIVNLAHLEVLLVLLIRPPSAARTIITGVFGAATLLDRDQRQVEVAVYR